MDYKNKYLKYKKKYIELKDDIENELISQTQLAGGKKSKNKINDISKINEILDFIEKSNIKKIQKELINIINYNNYCPKVLGEGHFGLVYIPAVNKTLPYKIGSKEIKLPVVIKDSKNIDNPDMYFGLDIINNTLYINSHDNITTEAIILMYIQKLYPYSVNLPLILGYSTCINKNIINRIITLKQGLDELIEIDLTKKIYTEEGLWHFTTNNPIEIFKSNLGTIKDLFTYIYYKKEKDGTVDLPNGIKCNITELFDYLCISYLATHQLLIENNIYPSDMHDKNIFIHWLNDNSYYGEKNIKDLEEIVYKVGKKYYKIKTFGLLLIIGDTGTFVAKIKKDIILAGQIWNVTENYKLLEKRFDPSYTAITFLEINHKLLTRKEYEKTICKNILNSEPYCSVPINKYILLGSDKWYLDKLKTPIELLEFFEEKYSINKYVKSDNNILIEAKKYLK